MNSMGMVIQQVQPGQASSGKSKTVIGDQAEQFQSLLSQSSFDYMKEDVNTDSDVNKNIVLPLFNMEELPMELQQLLKDYELTGNTLVELVNQIVSINDQSLITSIDIEDSIPEELWGYMDQIISAVTNSEIKNKNSTDLAIDGNSINTRLMESYPSPSITDSTQVSVIEKIDEPMLQKQFTSLVTQVQDVISKLNTQEDMIKAAPKILELLQQWQELSKSSGNKNLIQQQVFASSDETIELGIWKNVLETFQKREHFAGKQLYNTDAKVTVSDISKWIGNAIEVEKVNQTNIQLNTSMPMSKLEQYAIYINQSQSAQTLPAEQQLMEQFQKIMNASKFTALPNGTNQLSIALRPDNLGEMMVRFTQINGEMTLKILVTSAAAKEMLESNIHQLKNMFSPHQVVIEKQELTVQSGNTQKEQESDQLKDQGGQQSGQSDQTDKQNSDTSFELQFEELLMNEKV